LLRTRLTGRAEPLYIDSQGLRSAASLWSGVQVWAQLLRTQPDSTHVVVWRAERVALLQLLVAALWDGRTLVIEARPAVDAPASFPSAWCLDGCQVLHGAQPICRLSEGGWPELAGTAPLSILEMLSFAPQAGDIAVREHANSHGDLWLALGAPLLTPPPAPLEAMLPETAPTTEVLAPWDLAALAAPHDVLGDTLLPLLRCAEVWERDALPPA
jgi:hypothetical protein